MVQHGVDRHDMLEHLHADDALIRSGVLPIVELADPQESEAGPARETPPAIIHLAVVELGADGCERRRRRLQERQESSVAMP